VLGRGKQFETRTRRRGKGKRGSSGLWGGDDGWRHGGNEVGRRRRVSFLRKKEREKEK